MEQSRYRNPGVVPKEPFPLGPDVPHEFDVIRGVAGRHRDGKP